MLYLKLSDTCHLLLVLIGTPCGIICQKYDWREESLKSRKRTDPSRASKDRILILSKSFLSRSKVKEGGFSTRKTDCGFHVAKFPEQRAAQYFTSVTIQNDDDDDWRGVQRAFNKILVQRARMNNRPCEWAGRPSWRAREDENISYLLRVFHTGHENVPRNTAQVTSGFSIGSTDSSMRASA